MPKCKRKLAQPLLCWQFWYPEVIEDGFPDWLDGCIKCRGSQYLLAAPYDSEELENYDWVVRDEEGYVVKYTPSEFDKNFALEAE